MSSNSPILYGNPVEWDHPLNRGLVSWWLPLPGRGAGFTLHDIAGKNAGTLTNGPTWVPGPNGFGAVNFDGTDDYVDLPQVCDDGVAGFTFGAWVRPTASADGYFLSRGADGAGNGWSVFGQALAGGVATVSTVTGGTQATASGTTTLVANQWYHIIGRYIAFSEIRLYVNGKSEGAASPSATSLRSSSVGIRLGRINTTLWFNGALADVWWANDAWTDGRIAALYDQSLRGHPDTLRRLTNRVYGFGVAALGGTIAPLAVHHRKMQRAQ